uniref:Aldo_ket_red domain-containing protein n=1 Tax=Rhabditophanes sp. KR3021 TaxID=114890 RepID=A0AC35TWS3_9BILA
MNTTVKFTNGVEMPQLGLGTWLSKPEEIRTSVEAALANGYKLIDTATLYENEAEIGEVLQKHFKDGSLKREDIFLTTKLWCTSNRECDVEPALRESLKRLQLDYVDLYLVHIPGSMTADWQHDKQTTLLDTWKGMEGVYQKKLTRAIGLSNVSLKQIQNVMDHGKVPVHNVQNECNILLQQDAIFDYCLSKGITFTSYASLTSPGRRAYTALEWKEDPAVLDQKSSELFTIAERVGKSNAQVLLKWLLKRGICVIPKSVNPARVKENCSLFDFDLTADDITKINTQMNRQRIFLHEFLIGHPEDPYVDEREPVKA